MTHTRSCPHPADLRFAKGRITTTHGAVDASWSINGGTYRATLKAPKGTTGRLGVPTSGKQAWVRVDGRLVWDGKRALADGVTARDGYVYISGLDAGKYSIVSRPTHG